MANTYTQIHIHSIFAVQNKISLIKNEWEEDLYRYITGIVTNQGHKLLGINGTHDHVHMLFGMRPVQSLSNLMQEIKRDSSRWINKEGFTSSKFNWQEGFGAFSYSKSQLHRVLTYIENQKVHHRTIPFLEEYRSILKKFGVEYDENFVFKPIENL